MFPAQFTLVLMEIMSYAWLIVVHNHWTKITKVALNLGSLIQAEFSGSTLDSSKVRDSKEECGVQSSIRADY